MKRTFVVAQLPSAHALVETLQRLRGEGVRDLDTHSPYPLHGGDEALGLGRSRAVPLIAITAAVLGVAGGYLLQWWMNAHDYPLLVGSRPPNGLPAFVPVMFELAILSAGVGMFLGLLALCGLPRPYHPVFDHDEFRSASIDAFWLSAIAEDAKAAESLASRLRDLGATNVSVVEERE